MQSFIRVIVSLMLIHAGLTIIKDLSQSSLSAKIDLASAWLAENSMLVGFIFMFTLFIALNVVINRRNRKEYLKIPTVYEYASKNPNHKAGQGHSCNRCGSRSIRNWGWTSANDSDRIFICNHCGEFLYRN